MPYSHAHNQVVTNFGLNPISYSVSLTYNVIASKEVTFTLLQYIFNTFVMFWLFCFFNIQMIFLFRVLKYILELVLSKVSTKETVI